jgi:outer membrane protein assembly factor BamB
MKKEKQQNPRAARIRRILSWSLLGLVVMAAIYGVIRFVPFGTYDFSAAPTTLLSADGIFSYSTPLDPASPWPKFRANELQNGRSPIRPVAKELTPWSYRTGKGIFSTPVVDGDGNSYIGSADTYFYKFAPDGSVLWKFKTGGIIDSSALLDDEGRVCFGAGDSYVYCLDRETGTVLWKTAAHSVEEVEQLFGIKAYNVNWFEGNIGILPDGTLLAPNDNYLLYSLDRNTGAMGTIYPADEMIWSLPAVNPETNLIFFTSVNQILKNVYAYDFNGGQQWLTGSFGSMAASPLLTNTSARGAVVVGGFDGYLRAFAQDSGKLLWKFGMRDHIYASPAQLSDGTLIQPSTDGTLYAIEPTSGKLKWQFDTLEPIRSSPAVDGSDITYFGGGDGRLYSVNPDGTLRWSYLLITDDRNDLNSSPALGFDGIYIAGESGEMFFVPYDYPLSAAGKNDPRTYTSGENMPSDGAHLIYTNSFGAMKLEPDTSIDANAPLTFSLLVRENGDTQLSTFDRNSVKVTIPGNEGFRVEVGANDRFVNIVPVETWQGDETGNINVRVTADYKTNLNRFGLKFFGGTQAGSIDETFTFKINPVSGTPDPFVSAAEVGSQSILEFSRLSAPIPSILPSYNQIGFDSLHYIGGSIAPTSDGRQVLWVVGGKLDENNQTVVDPSAITRYPLMLEYKDGLVTIANYDGFKTKFIGSWDMPFASYRISDTLTKDGQFAHDGDLVAVANCDEIEFYGIGLKLIGMSEFKTGQMFVRGATKISSWPDAVAPAGVGNLKVTNDGKTITAEFSDTSLQADEHVFSLLLTDAKGNPLPLYYTQNTSIEASADGTIHSVTYTVGEDEDITPSTNIYVLVDTYPVYMEKE